MKFNSKDTVFGRHETFALRYGWLPKGYQSVIKNSKIFHDDLSTVELGVGKNMVKSIRHWLRATQMMDQNDSPTNLGDYLLGECGADPFLEDEASMWLVHWLLVSNARLATTWYWFFNCFHRREFTSEEVVASLNEFVKERVNANPAIGTLKNDAMMVLKMYCAPEENGRLAYEDILDAPLSMLGLLSHVPNNKLYQSIHGAQPGLPDAIFAFALSQVVNNLDGASVPIEELMYSDNEHISLGGVFRLTESEFVARLERICLRHSEYYEIRDTAGISQLYIMSKPDPAIFLDEYYKPLERVVV